MDVEIRDKPVFANLHVALQAVKQFIAEADTLASMSSTIGRSTQWSWGAVNNVLKRVFGGESMLVNSYTAALSDANGFSINPLRFQETCHGSSLSELSKTASSLG